MIYFCSFTNKNLPFMPKWSLMLSFSRLFLLFCEKTQNTHFRVKEDLLIKKLVGGDGADENNKQ